MIRSFRHRILAQKASLMFSDVLALLISFLLARFIIGMLQPEVGHITFKSVGIAKFGGLIVILVFWYQEQYVKRRPSWEELALLCKTIFIFALLHMGISFLISHHVIKLFNILFWFSVLVVLPLLRYITKLFLSNLGLWARNVYIIGTGKNALVTAELLTDNSIIGYKVIAFVAVNDAGCIENDLGIKVIPYEKLLNHDASNLNAEIVFALSSSELVNHTKKINVLQTHYAFVSIVPDITGIPLYGAHVEHFFGNDQLFLRLQNNLGRRSNRIIKRITDIIMASCGLVLLFPFIIIIAALIVITTRNKAFYKHKRVGKYGKYFYCLKFQTMHPNSQEILEELLASDSVARAEWEKDFKLRNDPRVTTIGRFLRNTSLDEIPQLFNVLLGEMSMVGPRPIIEAEIAKYNDDYYYYQLAHPGITGLWQISGRNDINYMKRVRLDVCYIKNWSLWYDFVILLKTVQVVLKRNGAY